LLKINKEETVMGSDNTQILSIDSLHLSNFRNYVSLRLDDLASTPIVITGPNGAGKTNILEAISLFTPGKGIRGAKLEDMSHKAELHHANSWSITGEVEGIKGKSVISTFKPADSNKRVISIDGNTARTHNELSNLMSIIWLTPQMDQIFISSASTRRKFLDRLVYSFDGEHAKRVANYEFFMRERIKLLKRDRLDLEWISVVERKMAEFAIAIAVARVQIIEYLQNEIDNFISPFPKAIISIKGSIENKVIGNPALQLEEEYKQGLLKNRGIDAQTGRTSIGVHKTDLKVVHAIKSMEAGYCSTGEQKTLLVCMILASARMTIKKRSYVPVLLLDEVIAHLDEDRRAFLLDDIRRIKAQAWLTGTDLSVFSSLKNHATFFQVEGAKLR
jgi:DNA replication and repair protein RecF